MRLLPFQRLTACPYVPLPIDSGNYFGARVRIFLYAIAPSFVYSATDNRTYRVGPSGSLPFDGAPTVRASAGNTVWSGRACPPDLLSTLPQTIVIRLRGFGTPGTAWGTQHNRLFDTSSGSGWRLGAERQTNTEINPYSASFGDTGYGVNAFTIPPYNPLSIGMVYLGSNTVRHFVNGRFAHQDTVTADAGAAGTDTRLDFGGSVSSNVDYQFGMWLKGSLTDTEMADLMANPWQVLRPLRRRGFVAAGGGGPVSVALTGEDAVTAQGAMVPVIEVTLTGEGAVTDDGVVTATALNDVTLTGEGITTAQGALGVVLDIPLVGEGAVTDDGTVTATSGLTSALTGEDATTAQGTLGVVLDIPLVGEGATTAQGSMVVNIDVALTGEDATTAQGTLSVTVTVGLTGAAAATAQGAMTPVLDIPLVGEEATTAQGTVSPDGNITQALTGESATTAQGALTPAIAVTLTGLGITTDDGTITPDTGTVVGLGGLSTTTTQGAFGVVLTVPFTGQISSGTQGACVPGINKSCTGGLVTGTAGAMVPALEAVLNGFAAIMSQGSMGIVVTGDVVQALTGIRLITGFGFFSFPGSGRANDMFALTVVEELTASAHTTEEFATTKTDELTVLN